MLSFSEVYLPVILIVDLSLAIVVQHSPFPVSCLCLHCIGHLNALVVTQIACTCMRMTTITLRVQNLINSLLTEMIIPQTYKYIYTYKLLPVSRVFGAHSASPKSYITPVSMLSWTARRSSLSCTVEE